jgi:prevent-host-death family protein
MEPQRVNSTDLRTKTRDILAAAHFLGQHFIVENHGRPMAVVIGIDEYERLMSALRCVTEDCQKAVPTEVIPGSG